MNWKYKTIGRSNFFINAIVIREISCQISDGGNHFLLVRDGFEKLSSGFDHLLSQFAAKLGNLKTAISQEMVVFLLM
ncbi:hypothetical protein [Vibrio parahaemolyticus]